MDDITSESLRQFIDDCWLKLFSSVVIRMTYEWKNFRRPTEDERKWYEKIWGEVRATRFFMTFNQNLKSAQKKGGNRKLIKRYINQYDRAIAEEFREINDDNYSSMIEKYPPPTKMLLELVYPQFLREYHEQQGLLA